ncbi:MAG: hypothetical protein K2N94_14950 [Lachnospiraceae bacterium]|nr:hypothetical protein [Lachnospiraceae bacterium]
MQDEVYEIRLAEDRRYFSLTSEIRQGNRLYVVSTNSFLPPSLPSRKNTAALQRLPTATMNFLWMW